MSQLIFLVLGLLFGFFFGVLKEAKWNSRRNRCGGTC
jgi:hypothetical protein